MSVPSASTVGGDAPPVVPRHRPCAAVRQAKRLASRVSPLLQQIKRHVQQQARVAASQHWTSAEEFLLTQTGTATSSTRKAKRRELSSNQTGTASTSPPSPPPLLAHQKEGVRWLLALHAHRLNGIVADEMGLGKTVQLIAFFSALARHGVLGTYLIVAPLSTLANWEKELHRWTPWLSVVLYHGDHDERAKRRAQLRRRHRRAFAHRAELLSQYVGGVSVTELAADIGGVVLTSYEMVLMDHGALVRCLPWDVTVVDEAHRLKRLDGKLLHEMKKAPAESMRVILTGTPVQNTVEELWTLLEYIAPRWFDTTEEQCALRDAVEGVARQQQQKVVASHWISRKRYRSDSETEGDTDEATAHDGGDHTSAYGESCDTTESTAEVNLLSALQSALLPFLLRRTKRSAGLCLPPKYDITVPCAMTPQQRYYYDERVSKESRYSGNRLMHLRKCCLHPFLFDELTNEVKSGEKENVESTDRPHSTARAQLQCMLGLSGKLRLLHALLPRLQRQGRRVLIFSQMTRMLDLIEESLLLHNATTKDEENSSSVGETDAPQSDARLYSYLRLDGTSSTQERNEAIARFQSTAPPRDGDRMMYPCAVQPSVSSSSSRTIYVEDGVAADNAVFFDNAPLPTVLAVSQRVALSEMDGNTTSHSSKPPRHYKPWVSANFTTASLAKSDPSQSAPSTTADGAAKGEFVFLISTRTGGTGLNLTGADTVILFDGDFNPQNDRQAVDRCHRIGQSQPVTVYRLITPCSVEEHQLCIVQRKLRLATIVLESSRSRVGFSAPLQDPTDEVLWVATTNNTATSARSLELHPLRDIPDGCLHCATEQFHLECTHLDCLVNRQWIREQTARRATQS